MEGVKGEESKSESVENDRKNKKTSTVLDCGLVGVEILEASPASVLAPRYRAFPGSLC